MFKRCMTSKPTVGRKSLSEIVMGFGTKKKIDAPRISYDAFSYTDELTKKQMIIGDIKNKTGARSFTGQHKKNKVKAGSGSRRIITSKDTKKAGSTSSNRQQQFSQQRQIDQINDCFMLMKTTKLFQKSSLKDKLFAKNVQSVGKYNKTIDGMRKKKKQIREFIQDYVKNLNIQQFRRYMEPTLGDRFKLINPNILNLGKYMSNVISKQNIEKIIEEFLLSENKEKTPNKSISISIDDIYFPDEQRLKQLLFHHVFIKNKDFQNLIFPSQTKQIYLSIQEQAHSQNSFACNFKYDLNISDCNFQEFKEQDERQQSIKMPNKWSVGEQKLNKLLEERKNELIMAVQSGNIYDFLFLIIRWPKLLQFRDEKGNNILHIAAKTNNVELYSLALKEMGVSALKQRNNFGKTPAYIARMFGSFEIMAKNKQYGQI